jgi:cation:H+ antiporter
MMDAIVSDGLSAWGRDDSGRYLQSAMDTLAGMGPLFFLGLFCAASFLMIWRLNALERKGLEGTVLGTVIMPYASGFSNLMFAYVMGRSGGDGILVLENCLVNNVTTLTLLIGLPALLWSLKLVPGETRRRPMPSIQRANRLNYLSLLLTLLAALFFSGVLWALSRDGVLDFGDGLVMVGVFIFWQLYHLFDVLKQNVYQKRMLRWSMAADALMVVAGGIGVYYAIDKLVAWVPRTGSGILVFSNLGWLSGMLMVLPNAFLALFYAWRKRADIVYSSQVGDGHICIPLCIGLFALFAPIQIPTYFNLSIAIIAAAVSAHFLFLSIWGRLPRLMGVLFAAAYGYFLYEGIIR